jgi:hypothetical protein
VIEDRLRAVRLDEPRLDLDVDELVARAGRRRAILGAVVATCAVAVAMMAVGLAVGGQEERRSVPVAAASTPTPTRPASPPPTTVDDCAGPTPDLVKVITTHVPKLRVEQVSSCPVAVYRVVGTAEFLTFATGDAAVPLDGYVLTDDLGGPGDGRLQIYQGADRGGLAVLLVDPDGTVVSVSTTSPAGVFDVDALIALVTDPALAR